MNSPHSPVQWDVPVIAGLNGKEQIVRIQVRVDDDGKAWVLVLHGPGEGDLVPDESVAKYRAALAEAQVLVRRMNARRRLS